MAPFCASSLRVTWTSRARALRAIASSKRLHAQAVVARGPSLRTTALSCDRIPPRCFSHADEQLWQSAQYFPFRKLSKNPILLYALQEGVDAFAGITCELKSPAAYYLADISGLAAHRSIYIFERCRRRSSWFHLAGVKYVKASRRIHSALSRRVLFAFRWWVELASMIRIDSSIIRSFLSTAVMHMGQSVGTCSILLK